MEMTKTLLRPDEYAAVLRTDFCSFLSRCFLELSPEDRLLMNWHIEVLAAKLEACRQGKIRRLIINLPPRHLKSLCASVAFPAWLLGHDPTVQIICASYGQDLSDKLARDFRTIVAVKWYQALFGSRFLAQRQAVAEFVTTAGGFRLATSVGGTLTGRGADFIIIDDPLKPDEALSDSQRQRVNDWLDGTLLSRLNDKAYGVIIIIMQRLHEDDLVGHVLAQGGWDIVSFPAIAERDELHVIETPFGVQRFKRRIGDLLHPERESAATLARIRATMGEYNFAGQYQQAPAPSGGGMIKQNWFKSYDADNPPEFERIVQSWDTANKPGELNDHSVCTTWGIKNNQYFLIHVLRRRMAYPDLKRAVRELAQAYRPSVILIEDKASGTQLIQELIENRVQGVKRFKPEYDKVMRLHAQSGTIENGFVYLPKQASWLAEYVHELTTFPNGKHDDQTDSTSQFLAWIKQRSPYAGWLEWVARQADGTRVVKLRVSEGVTSLWTVHNRRVHVGPDQIVEMTQEEAQEFVAKGFKEI
jgi:predicted phage terminase large subunit-like protein